VAKVVLEPRPVHRSVDELLAGAERLGPFVPVDARSPAGFERVAVDGEPCVVKYVHVDDDFAIRASGDIGCIPLRVWEAGLMDAAPELIDHATIGVARWGRNGWGAALLMRDVGPDLVPVGDDPVTEEQHLGFVAAAAGLAARTWGWRDELQLLPAHWRWSFFSPWVLDCEAELGDREPVPAIARQGWERFRERAPSALLEAVAELHRDPGPLHGAIGATPTCFLHGDWKFGNLGRAADDRTVLIDWAYAGEGPIAHELAWYLALNRARLPPGHPKERVIDDFGAALRATGLDTSGWWERQVDLCLLGAVVQFGWEKALGPDDELAWWCDRADAGVGWL
jgi:hypothetical protein